MPVPERHDCAVAFCLDRNFFALALFMIWQIAHLNPNRRFDFVIASHDDLVVPDWAKGYGIVLHRPGPLPEGSEVARFRNSMSTLFRLMLARELGDRYRRIIYMDSDMFVEGGDLHRLMEIDLGPHPIAAVLDYPNFRLAVFHADEFKVAGLPALPYFNSGFQVIDTRAYREQEVEQRAFAVCKTHRQPITFSDQTLINLVLKGKFAQLAPCWNWQLNFKFPHFGHFYPVFNHHFIGQKKPNRLSDGLMPARFNQAYRHFMTQFGMAALADLAPPPEPRMLSSREQALMACDIALAGRIAAGILARHPDPYRARL